MRAMAYEKRKALVLYVITEYCLGKKYCPAVNVAYRGIGRRLKRNRLRVRILVVLHGYTYHVFMEPTITRIGCREFVTGELS